MTTNSFVPNIWGARVVEGLRRNLVFASPSIINKNYDGEIKEAGDRVWAVQAGDVTLENYTPGTSISNPEHPVTAKTPIDIDHAKSFNFGVDNIDKVQSKPDLIDVYLSQAIYRLSNQIDRDLAEHMALNVSLTNTEGSAETGIVPNAVAGTTMYDHMLTMNQRLNEADVPTQGRFAVLSPWAITKLAADSKFTSVADSGSNEALRNGFVGRAASFDVYMSNNIYTDSTSEEGKVNYYLMFGHPSGTTFADQLLNISAYQPESSHEDAVKGLEAYGFKTIKPDCLAVLISRGST